MEGEIRGRNYGYQLRYLLYVQMAHSPPEAVVWISADGAKRPHASSDMSTDVSKNHSPLPTSGEVERECPPIPSVPAASLTLRWTLSKTLLGPAALTTRAGRSCTFLCCGAKDIQNRLKQAWRGVSIRKRRTSWRRSGGSGRG